VIFRRDISLSRWTYRLVVFLAVFYSSSTAVRAQESSKTGYDDSVVGISFFEKARQSRYAIPSLRETLNLNFLEAERVPRCILARVAQKLTSRRAMSASA
jgi:hypothetical protein